MTSITRKCECYEVFGDGSCDIEAPEDHGEWVYYVAPEHQQTASVLRSAAGLAQKVWVSWECQDFVGDEPWAWFKGMTPPALDEDTQDEEEG